jgi:hypothetical protein
MSKYRVFVSYSHEDREMAERLVRILEENGLEPIWDRNFLWGHGFHEQIKNFIAHAHVFVPVITEAASKRGWVHQEIGYAMALNLPILPVTLDRVPGEMLQPLLSVPWSDDDEILKRELSVDTFEKLIQHALEVSRPLYECAELHEDRTMMIVRYTRNLLESGFHGHVRQKGSLTSFHLPDKHESHPVWAKRLGDSPPNEFRCKWQRQERRALEEHVRKAGCSLIIDPYEAYKELGNGPRKVRLKTLLEFLEAMPDDKLNVVLGNRIPREQNLLIVGDWYTAESVSFSMDQGHRHTIFTRHAPTVQNRIDLFDHEFEDLSRRQRQEPGSSREAAILALKQIITEL